MRVALLALLLFGCSSESATKPSIPVDGGTVDSAPPLDRALCGAPTYSWLESPNLGEVTESDKTISLTTLLATALIAQFRKDGLADLKRAPKYESKVSRVVYRTQNRGVAVDATGLIAYPLAPAGTRLPLLLFLHGTSGMTDACAPSRAIENLDTTSVAGVGLPMLLASFGYVVAAPDLLGLKSRGDPSTELHPFLVAEPTAIAALDSIRAAKRFVAERAPDIVLGETMVLGASQGGHAGIVTLRYAPHYAPEIKPVGAVLAVPPLDLSGEAKRAFGGAKSASYLGAAMVALHQWYRGPAAARSMVLAPPHDENALQELARTCGPPNFDDVNDPQLLFTAEARLSAQQSFAGFDPWDCYLRENDPLRFSIEQHEVTPTMLILGEQDELLSTELETAAAATLCARGAKLEITTCSGASHAGAVLDGFDDALAFLDGCASGTCPLTPCMVSAPRRCTSTP